MIEQFRSQAHLKWAKMIENDSQQGKMFPMFSMGYTKDEKYFPAQIGSMSWFGCFRWFGTGQTSIRTF